MRNCQHFSFASLIKKQSEKPVFEMSDKEIEKLKSVAQVLVSILAITGLVAVTAVMPGFLSVIKTFYRIKRIRRLEYEEKNKKIIKTFYYLKEKGYIELYKVDRNFKIVLTKKGRTWAAKLQKPVISISKDKHWDKKYWQIAADIPTKYKSGADAFRREILKLGFFPLQRTLWFFPFDPRKEIELLSQKYLISPFVTVMKIEILDPTDQKNIQKHFMEKKII
ncbi:MAG: hypothetical protein FJZ04_01640 [Candidatus Moranbacteria bacterium]|nr:hypothetical protein [Candidatus Moranbacteria bacterium]